MKKASLFISIFSSILVLASLLMLGITFGWFANVIDLNDIREQMIVELYSK